LLGIQDKVKEFEWLIMFIYHRNVCFNCCVNKKT
jgi:hypothetical protein